jgi:hypothetical protein
MSQRKNDEELLPAWLLTAAKVIGPIAGLMLVYWVMKKLHLPAGIITPAVAVLGLAALIYFGGAFYKPFYADKQTGRCTAKTAKDRKACRRYVPGARLGGGCGRLREDRACRYVKG